jgi:YVTN family beta-propeller protein
MMEYLWRGWGTASFQGFWERAFIPVLPQYQPQILLSNGGKRMHRKTLWAFSILFVIMLMVIGMVGCESSSGDNGDETPTPTPTVSPTTSPTALSVTGTSYPDGTTEFPTNGNLVITFNQPIVAGAGIENITLMRGTIPWNVTGIVDGNTLTIDPTRELYPLGVYTINIPADAVEPAGSSALTKGLPEPIVFDFTVADFYLFVNDKEGEYETEFYRASQFLPTPVPIPSPYDAIGGNEPRAMALSPDKNTLVISDRDDDLIRVIDVTDTENPVETMDTVTFDDPFGMVFSPDGSLLYVAVQDDNTVAVVDTATWTEVGTPITVGDDPRHLAITKDGRYIYCGNYYDDTLSVIDTTTNTVVKTIDLGYSFYPLEISISPDGNHGACIGYNGRLYTFTPGVFDNSETKGSYSLAQFSDGGYNFRGIKFSPDSATMYVTGGYVYGVVVVETSNPASAYMVYGPGDDGYGYWGLGISPGGDFLFGGEAWEYSIGTFRKTDTGYDFLGAPEAYSLYYPTDIIVK